MTCSEKNFLTENGGDIGRVPGILLTLSPELFTLIVLQCLSVYIPISKEVCY